MKYRSTKLNLTMYRNAHVVDQTTQINLQHRTQIKFNSLIIYLEICSVHSYLLLLIVTIIFRCV